jgi:hypothetical protein
VGEADALAYQEVHGLGYVLRERFGWRMWLLLDRRLKMLSKFIFDFIRDYPDAELTGSCFFGNATESSDVDFIAPEYYKEVLIEDGFEVLPTTAYTDSSVCCVLVKDNVHVQVCATEEELKFKLQARDLLASLPRPLLREFVNSSKAEKKLAWEWALNQVRMWE